MVMLLDVVLVSVLLSVLLMLLMLLMKSRRRRVVMVMLIALVMMVTAVADGTLLFLTLTTRLFIDLFDGSQFLLQFHAPILEPDFDLAFSEAECVGDFNSPPPSQIVIEVEFFFQFQSLVARVRLASTTSKSVGT